MDTRMMRRIARVAGGGLTVEAVAREKLALLAKENPRVNAVVECHPDECVRAAREIDRQLAEGRPLRLAGAVVTVKDNLNVRGLKTTAGLARLKNNVAASDCDAVARLRAEGALILGKTNMPSGAMDVQTDNPVYGRTNHPVFLDLTCGGSCGGGACAVALRLSDVDIGNDVMGSVRIPAGFCGVFGFVPSPNAIDLDGFAGGEPMGSTFSDILRIGLLAQTAEDIRFVLPSLLRRGYPASTEHAPAKPAVAWADDCGGLPLSKATSACLERFRREADPTGAWYRLLPEDYDFNAARTGLLRLLYGAIAARVPPPAVFAERVLAKNRLFSNRLSDYLEAENVRESCIRRLDRLFERFDCLIVPVTATPAFLHRKPDRMKGVQPVYDSFDVDGANVNYAAANLGYTTPFFTAHPAVAVPVGQTESGLPVGVQVVGGYYREYLLLEISQALRPSAPAAKA